MPSVYVRDEAAAPRQPHTDEKSPLRMAPIIAIYTGLGPPIGGVLTSLSLFAVAMFEAGGGSLTGFSTRALESVLGLIVLIPISALYGYYLGGIQAFLTGAIIAFASRSKGGFGYVTAFLAPLAVGVVAGVLMVTDFRLDFTRVVPGEYMMAAILAAIGVVASLILRFLFRRRFAPACAP